MIASNRSYESVRNATKRGFLLPVVDENGQPWTVLRCARIFLGFALLFAAAWVAMWVTA